VTVPPTTFAPTPDDPAEYGRRADEAFETARHDVKNSSASPLEARMLCALPYTPGTTAALLGCGIGELARFLTQPDELSFNDRLILGHHLDMLADRLGDDTMRLVAGFASADCGDRLPFQPPFDLAAEARRIFAGYHERLFPPYADPTSAEWNPNAGVWWWLQMAAFHAAAVRQSMTLLEYLAMAERAITNALTAAGKPTLAEEREATNVTKSPFPLAQGGDA